MFPVFVWFVAVWLVLGGFAALIDAARGAVGPANSLLFLWLYPLNWVLEHVRTVWNRIKRM